MSDAIKTTSVFVLLCIILAGIALFSSLTPVQAAPAYQLTEFPTPTPGTDGRILYTVQEGDTLWRIAAVTGVSLDELRQLNNLSADAVIREGQVLLLGVVAAPVATAAPGNPDATLPPADQLQLTPTPAQNASAICALLYLDVNGNAFRDENEIPLADGEVSVTERLGAFSNKKTTVWDDVPVCFENIPPGEYIITMALPTGFNRTTELSLTIELAPGDTSYINFGAQPSGSSFLAPTAQISGEDTSSGGNSLFAILGVTVLLAGIGVGIWAAMNGRRQFTREN